mgnify:CR=1 FL=1
MLSLLNIPFKLLMNILTIINTVILTVLILIIYYIYINKEQIYDYVKNIFLNDIIKTDFNTVLQKSNRSSLLSNNYNEDQSLSPF